MHACILVISTRKAVILLVEMNAYMWLMLLLCALAAQQAYVGILHVVVSVP